MIEVPPAIPSLSAEALESAMDIAASAARGTAVADFDAHRESALREMLPTIEVALQDYVRHWYLKGLEPPDETTLRKKLSAIKNGHSPKPVSSLDQHIERAISMERKRYPQLKRSDLAGVALQRLTLRQKVAANREAEALAAKQRRAPAGLTLKRTTNKGDVERIRLVRRIAVAWWASFGYGKVPTASREYGYFAPFIRSILEQFAESLPSAYRASKVRLSGLVQKPDALDKVFRKAIIPLRGVMAWVDQELERIDSQD